MPRDMRKAEATSARGEPFTVWNADARVGRLTRRSILHCLVQLTASHWRGEQRTFRRESSWCRTKWVPSNVGMCRRIHKTFASRNLSGEGGGTLEQQVLRALHEIKLSSNRAARNGTSRSLQACVNIKDATSDWKFPLEM